MGASLHLAKLLDSQYQSLLAQWLERAAALPGGAAQLGPHIPALLRRLITEIPVPEAQVAPGGTELPLDIDLQAVVLGYGLLQRLVLELLERASVPVSMRDVRRLGEWFTSAVASAAAAHASHAPASTRRTGHENADAPRSGPEDTLRSAGQAPPSSVLSALPPSTVNSQLETALRDSEERLRLLSQSALIGTWVVDVMSQQVSADAHVLGAFGLPAGSEQPLSAFLARIAPEFLERCVSVVRASLRGAGCVEAEFRVLDAEQNPAGWLEARAKAVLDDNGDAVRFIGTLADVTGRKAAELEREQLRESERRARERAQRVTRRQDEFLATVSHELRTPLTLLLAPVADALAAPGGHLEGRALQLVHDNAQRLLELIEHLLALGELDSGLSNATFEPVDVCALTAAIAGSFRPLIEDAGLALTVHCAPLPRPSFVDRRAWEQIVSHLLSNAFKFTLDGEIEVSLAASDGEFELAVSDTGAGIPEAELGLIFERFHRVGGARGRSFEGSGVGLALVQQLARLHGGAVNVESRLGQGSRFVVRLPFGSEHLPAARIRSTPAGPEQPLAPPRSVRDALGGRPELRTSGHDREPVGALPAAPRGHVIVADDNADMREYLSQLLGNAGWSVRAVSDGRAALESALASLPDLIVSDVAMPRLDGFELHAALARHEWTRRVPTILLAARAEEHASLEQEGAAMPDILVKPFSGRELLARVEARVAVARAAQQAEQAEERWRSLLMQAPVAISLVRGPEFVYELVNPLALAMVGGRDVAGKSVREAFPELSADAPAIQLLERVYGTGQAFNVEEYAIPLDLSGHGTLEDVYFKFSCQPIRDAKGDVQDLLTVAIDVSAQVHARQRTEALLSELTRADQRKDEFLAMLAHELRNPIAAISTALTLLEHAERDPVKEARYRDIARRQMGNLVRLVDDLLDVARITRGQVTLHQEDVDLDVVVQHALAATRPAVEAHRHELRVRISPGVYRLVGDGTRLEQVIVNLLTNAAKYTEPGGRISVSLEREEVAAGPCARLLVCDTGRGIAPEMLDKVFEPFTQVSPGLDRSTGGLGLGLTLVKHLVEMHGGSVSAHSAGRGQGSEFHVHLPLSAQATAAERVEPARGALEPGARRERVLVVEDSEDVRELLEECIKKLGHDVLVAANGIDGAEVIERERPTVALVDVGLPGIDGYELARRVRASPDGREVRLVALSGYGGAEAKRAARAAGFDLHVTKPIELGHLRDILAGSASE